MDPETGLVTWPVDLPLAYAVVVDIDQPGLEELLHIVEAAFVRAGATGPIDINEYSPNQWVLFSFIEEES